MIPETFECEVSPRHLAAVISERQGANDRLANLSAAEPLTNKTAILSALQDWTPEHFVFAMSSASLAPALAHMLFVFVFVFCWSSSLRW